MVGTVQPHSTHENLLDVSRVSVCLSVSVCVCVRACVCVCVTCNSCRVSWRAIGSVESKFHSIEHFIKMTLIGSMVQFSCTVTVVKYFKHPHTLIIINI